MSVESPSSAKDLMEYAKVQLGQGATKINVTDDQLKTRMREAFDKFNTFHYNATEHVYIAQQIVEEDTKRRFFVTPDFVKNVIRVFTISASRTGDSSSSLWIPGGMVPTGGWMESYVAGGYGNLDPGVGPYGMTNSVTMYLMDMQQATYENIYNPEEVIRYNELTHRLFPDMSMGDLKIGNFIVYEAYAALEGLGMPQVYNDGWLKKYYTALVGQQWGANLTKFVNSTLYGGDAALNGQGILDFYTNMRKELEEELMVSYTAQTGFWVG